MWQAGWVWKERVISFMDADDNTLLVRLAPERMQLAVVDSRPAIEGSELRAFASAVFRAYVGPPLAAELAAAASQLVALEAVLAPAQAAQLAAARRAIEAAQVAMSEPEAAAEPARATSGPAWLDPTANPAAEVSVAKRPRRPRKPRTFRCGEGYLLDWGWRRIAVEPESQRSSCVGER